MVRPYSLDLRERVVAAAEAGQPCRAVGKRFGVSVSSVVKWRQRARATGSAAAKPMGGKRPVLLARSTCLPSPGGIPCARASHPPLWAHAAASVVPGAGCGKRKLLKAADR